MDDGLVGVEDILPVLAGKLGFEVDHGAKGSAAVEFGRDPGVPVADGGEGPVEVALVQCPWNARVAGAGAVGPVPENAALFDDHCDGIVRISLFKRGTLENHNSGICANNLSLCKGFGYFFTSNQNKRLGNGHHSYSIRTIESTPYITQLR